MKPKFNLQTTTFAFVSILSLFFIVEYIYNRNYKIIFIAIYIFLIIEIILILTYMFLLLDNRYKLTYANFNQLSDKVQNQFIKDDIKNIQEVEKGSYYKKLLFNIIFKVIYLLGLFELIIITHFLIFDISYINKAIIYTFPAFLALIITITDIFQKIKKKIK